ncbi:MAG: MBL fold metallo-hydrolase [Treponema sp.]|jgi:L-ascorbate 6-phosphate lactonase|nr:MBL fold metallo-hydrolase [Treponema sp.]
MSFINKLENARPGEKELALVWLGQAGFLIKTHQGKIILIDPYLTDYVNRVLQKDCGQGFRRMAAPLFEPEEIKADILLCSHEHQDHLDIDAMPGLLKNKTMKAYVNIASIGELKKNHLDVSRFSVVTKGNNYPFDEFVLTVTDCDHGSSTPEALGFILDFGFTAVYFSGDTSYNKERLSEVLKRKIDIALLPINGAFGNLNAYEAAELARDTGAKLCIPHHFWTFPAHSAPLGSPGDAIAAFPEKAPQCRLNLATPGEIMTIR